MDVLSALARHVTCPLYARHDGYDLADHRRALMRSQFLPGEAIEKLQLERLGAIVDWAYRANAFHRERLEQCGFRPGDLRDLKDLARLPVLTKDDIRDRLCSELSQGFTRANTLHKRTGGSTGVPVHVYVDYEAASAKRAAVERHDEWAGRRMGDRLAAIWGDTQRRPPAKDRLRNALTERTFYLDTLHFDSKHLDAFLAQIRRLAPPVLLGHAHSVYRFAEYVRDLAATRPRFRSIITTAMVLSESERKVIEEVFGAPVFDRYGCEEVSIIASECPAHAGLHVCAELLLAEVLGEDPRYPGRILITDLMNRAMPLIRYEIGDSGLLSHKPCSCGRGLPLLEKVFGRSADFLYTADGVPVFGISILDTFMIHIPGCKQTQIVQDSLEHLEIRILPDERFSDETKGLLRARVKEVFGERMTFTLRLVDRIELTERGKYRFSICKIDPHEKKDKRV